MKKRGKINTYHLADIHGCFNYAKATASYFGSRLDLLILNSNYCKLDIEEDYVKLCRFLGEISGGKIPVILVRGNHDCRGTLADGYTDRLNSNVKDTYYTFQVGWLRGIVPDLGEDKGDENIEYGGVNDFYGFRRRKTQFLKRLKAGKSKPLFAIYHSYPGFNTQCGQSEV